LHAEKRGKSVGGDKSGARERDEVGQFVDHTRASGRKDGTVFM